MLLLLIGFFSLSFSAEARTVIRSGDTVSLASEQQIEGDFYTAAGRTNLSGTVTEDLLSIAGQIRVNGTVGQDVFILAGTADVLGSVGDDVRIIAGEAVVAESVAGDVFVISGTVDILSTAAIAGDLVVYGGDVTVAGTIEGDILGGAERLRVDGPVGGGIDVEVGLLTLGANASVTDAVRYTSTETAVRAPDAIVGAELVRNDPPIITTQSFTIEPILMPILVVVFGTLVWFLLSRYSLDRVTRRALRISPRAGLIGFAALMIVPLSMLLLFVSQVGLLLGILVLLGYLLLFFLAVAAVPVVLGQLLLRVFNQPTTELSLLSVVVGVVAIGLLLLLPILGPILLAAAFVVTFGALTDLVLKPIMQRT